ncbi:MAG TPA: thioredoxin domain-containing protein [Candidatus Saccharimonadales bacterium]|jgi:protein-disulfide isomerase
MTKKFWIAIAVIVVILVGVFAFSASGNNNDNSKLTPTEHIEGEGKDGVTLVEYGDYECPYCGEYYSTVKQVVATYNTQITFQFRNFPLTSIHPNAFAGARAAEAAGLMGQFWQMHDLLYQENQIYYDSNESNPTWIGQSNPEPVFEQYAKSLGLNVTKFEQLYASDQVNNLVVADENAGNSLGIDATPTFYLDGKQVEVDNTPAAFEKLINAAIAQKAGKTASATTTAGTTSQSKN